MCKGDDDDENVDASVKAKNGDKNTGANNKNTEREIGVECTVPLRSPERSDGTRDRVVSMRRRMPKVESSRNSYEVEKGRPNR
jgi:hypothetical protein